MCYTLLNKTDKEDKALQMLGRLLNWLLKICLTFLIVLSIGLILVEGIKGCMAKEQKKEEKWFNEYMSQIPVDERGYEFCDLGESGAIKIENTTGNFIVQGVEISLSYSHRDDFELVYNNQTIQLNSEFLHSKTEVYGTINAMWTAYAKEDPPTTLYNHVFAVMVHNERLLIFTSADNKELWGGRKNEYPVVMYTYDILSDKVLYLGYRKDSESAFRYTEESE